LLIIDIMATLTTKRSVAFCGALVEWIEINIVLAEQILILADSLLKLPLRKSALSLPRIYRGGDAFCLELKTIRTRNFPITFDFALLAKQTSKCTLGL
jgi:hypothetical protein